MYSDPRNSTRLAKRLAALAFYTVLLGIAAPSQAGDGSLTDANITYVGRWDKSNSTVYTSHWGGAYLRVNFTGNTIGLKIGTASNFVFEIDGKAKTLKKNMTGTVNLTPTALSGTSHTLRVSAPEPSDLISFKGLVLAAGGQTNAPASTKGVLEFVGNSITSGALSSFNCLTAFPFLTGDSLGYDHVQISFSGILLVDPYYWSYQGAPAAGMSYQFFKGIAPQTWPDTVRRATPDWDFTRYEPKAVIINLGTNDYSMPKASSVFQATYTTFLTNIRTKYPNAVIIGMRTFIGSFATETQAAVAARNKAGDKNVYYVNTDKWLTTADFVDGVHPNDAGHLKVALRLKPILSTYLPTASIDRKKPSNWMVQSRQQLRTNPARSGYAINGEMMSTIPSGYGGKSAFLPIYQRMTENDSVKERP